MAYNNPDSQYQSPFIRTARLVGLEPGATYRYALPGDEADEGFEIQKSMALVRRGAPGCGSRPATNQGALVLGVVGDTGQTEVTHAVFEHLGSATTTAPRVDLVLHTGDLSYADGHPPRWDAFGRLSEALFSRTPVLATPGNHDVTLNGLESTAYRVRYPSPHAASKSPSPDWWSWTSASYTLATGSAATRRRGRDAQVADFAW